MVKKGLIVLLFFEVSCNAFSQEMFKTLNLREHTLVKNMQIEGSNIISSELRLRINNAESIKSIIIFNVMGKNLKKLNF